MQETEQVTEIQRTDGIRYEVRVAGEPTWSRPGRILQPPDPSRNWESIKVRVQRPSDVIAVRLDCTCESCRISHTLD